MKMFWTLHEFMHMDIQFELKIIAHKKPHVAKVHLKGAICNPAVAHRMALLLIEHGEQAALTENKQDDGRCSLEEHSRCPLCRNSAEAPPRDHAEQL
ncbi:hypothetical protein PF002_g27726, partial [Phytophthora fragariae]